MHVLVCGSSGFVGSRLVPFLIEKGHQVTGMARHPSRDGFEHPAFRFLEGDGTRPGDWQDAAREADAVINLAGVSIFRRWSAKAKKEIYDSRILTTRHVVAALPENRPAAFLNTSAVGFYGPRGEETVDESTPAGDDFLARLSVDWEAEARAAEKKGARVVLDRFGIVLSRGGGALAGMLPAFRLGAGGPLGSGRQWFPWIHMEDLLAAHLFVLERPEVSGPVNFTAPNPVRNRDLAKSLGRVLNRPAFLRMPGFLLRAAAGEFGEVLLNGQYVLPAKLKEMGFAFSYPELEAALRDCLAE
jgi:hypothetical protein